MDEKTTIDGEDAFVISLLDFDRNIAAYEAKAADLKSQRAQLIYDVNIRKALSQHRNVDKNKIEKK